MPLHNTIGVATHTGVVISKDPVPATLPSTGANWAALFSTAPKIIELPNIRELPSFGSPANVVKVPEYGRTTSLSVGAQSDAPDLAFTLNYVPSRWAPGTDLATLLDNKSPFVCQVSFLRSAPASMISTAAGLGTVDNSVFYFVGKLESLLINTSLSDAQTATLTMSLHSAFSPIYTIAGA